MSSLTASLVLCCVLIVSEVVGQNNDVCLTLPRNQVDVSSKGLQGSPGKRGPVGGIGSKGAQGQKGEPGDVESCGCKPGDVIQLKEQINILNEFVRKSCFDGIVFEKKCIRLPYSHNSRVNFSKAQEICNSMNSSLAEIRSNAMFDRVYNYLLPKFKAYEGSESFIRYTWLGSTFEPTNNPNNLVTLSDGSKVRLTKWFPGYPDKRSTSGSFKRLIIAVNSDVTSNRRNLYNNPPSNGVLPLCSCDI